MTKRGKSVKRATKSKRFNENLNILVEAVETIQDYGIFMLDPEGRILTWNSGAERMHGYKASEIIGQSFSKFYTEQDLQRDHPQAELTEARRTGRYEEEGWRLRKDGTRFWANVVITRFMGKNKKLIGFSKVTRDLSARKEAEDILKESEERFRLLVEGVKDYAIFMLDPDGRVASWNQGAARIKGYEAHEIMGKYFSIFRPQEDIAAGKCEYELQEAALTGRFEDEGWRVRKDGSMLWANVVITAIRDRNRRLIGYTKVTRDLTEKRRAEERLQKAYADLERRVEERTAELSQAIKVRDDFLSIASHELKTPITSLKLQIQILQQRTKPELGQIPEPARLVKSLESSLRQVDRLTQLVEDLLDVARSQAKKLTFNFEPTNLNHLIHEIVERLKLQLEMAKCSIEIDTPETLEGNFDRFRLDQVLVNFVTNAIKYAPGTKVQIRLRKDGDRAILSVKDHGPGIAPAEHDKLFKRFERGENARNLSGLGLGLYIAKQIVEGHQGTVRLESTPAQGAEFIIELPLTLR